MRQKGHVKPRDNQMMTFERPRYAARSTSTPLSEGKENRGAGCPIAGGSGAGTMVAALASMFLDSLMDLPIQECKSRTRYKLLISQSFQDITPPERPVIFRGVRSETSHGGARKPYRAMPFSLKNRSAPGWRGRAIPTRAVWSVRFRAAACAAWNWGRLSNTAFVNW